MDQRSSTIRENLVVNISRDTSTQFTAVPLSTFTYKRHNARSSEQDSSSDRPLTMPPRMKRPLEVVDLTGADDDRPFTVNHPSSDPFEPRQKQPRLSGGASSVSSQYSSGRSHPPASLPSSRSSLSSSSQYRLSSQASTYGDGDDVIEPWVYGLTRDGDGPVRELYGTLGTCPPPPSPILSRVWQACGTN